MITSALGLTAECPQDLFDLMEPQNLKKALHLIKDNIHYRYTRRSAESDETPLYYGVTLAYVHNPSLPLLLLIANSRGNY